MKKVFRILFWLSLSILAICLLVVVLHWQTNIVSGIIEGRINAALEDVAEVHYESLEGSLLNSVILHDVSVRLADSSEISADYLKMDYDLLSALGGPIIIHSVFVDSFKATFNSNSTNAIDQPSETDTLGWRQKIATLVSRQTVDTLLHSLPKFTLTSFEIAKGNISVPKQDLTLDSLFMKAEAAVSDQELYFLLDRLTATWTEKQFKLNYGHAEIKASRERFTLNQLQLEAGNSALYANTDITLGDSVWIILNVQDTHFNYADLSKITRVENLKNANLSTDLHLVGNTERFALQFRIAGSVNEYAVDSLVVDADFEKGRFIIRDMRLALDKSKLAFTGSIGSKSSRGNLAFQNVDISRFYRDVIGTDLNGHIQFNVKKIDLKHMTGNGEIFLADTRIDEVHLDTLRFALNARDNFFRIKEPSYLKMADNSRFEVRGTLDRKLVIDAELKTKANDLPQLMSALSFDTLDGNFDGTLKMNGHLFDPDISGFLFLPFFSVSTVRLDTIRLDLTLEKAFSRRQGGARFSVVHGDLGGFPLTEARVAVRFDSNRVEMDTLRFASDENTINSRGWLEMRQDTIELGFNDFNLNYEKYWLKNNDDILISFLPDEINIEQALFEAPGNGEMEIRGFYDYALADLQAGLYLRNINIEPFRQFAPQNMDFSGMLEGGFEIITPLTAPKFDVEVNAGNLTYNHVSLGNVQSNFLYQNGSIYLQEFKLNNGPSSASIDGDIALRLVSENGVSALDVIEGTKANLELTWQNIDLAHYARLFKNKHTLEGEVSGALRVGGSIAEPLGQIELDLKKFRFNKFTSDSLILSGHFNRDSLIVDTLFTELNGTSFSGSGWQKIKFSVTEPDTELMNRPFELRMHSADDRITFLGLVMDQVEKIEGPYQAEFIIGGTPAKPALKSGSFSLDDGILTLSRVRNPITKVKVRAKIKDSIMTISSFSGYAEKEKDFWETGWSYVQRLLRLFKGQTRKTGTVSGSGTINLANVMHPRIDLDISTYQLHVNYFVENTDLVLSTDNLKIQGRDTLMVSGALTIDEGDYEVDLDKLQKNIYLSDSRENSGKTLAWNLDISLPGNFYIRSSALDLANNFQFKISGELRSIQEPFASNMELAGHMEMTTGKYGSWGQDFEIQSGTIDFTNPKVVNPDIDIRAEQHSGENIFILTVTGNLENRQINLEVADEQGLTLNGLSFADKLAMLTVGTSASNISGSGLVTAGEDVLNTSVKTVIERGAADLTGLDKVEIGSGQGIVNLKSMKLNNGLKDASISLGKYLTSNLYLEYKSTFAGGTIPAPRLSWQPGNQIGLEYRINKFWSVDSYYSQTLRGNNRIQLSLSWKTTF